jgi:ABC-type glycerol-3-phosphate transport system permease component
MTAIAKGARIAPHRKPLTGKAMLGGTVKYLFALFMLVFSLFPLIWIVISSLKGPSEIFSVPPSFIPENPTLENYIAAVSEGSLMVFVKNSVIVAVLTTLLSTIISSMAAYAVAFYRFRGRDGYNRALFATQLFPGVVSIIPLFVIFRMLNLLNRPIGLVVGNLAGALPVAIILMLGYFTEIPRDLEEAARIDGANTATVFFKVIFPLALPGISAAAILTFINVWQEFFMALSFTSDMANYTLPVGITTYVGERATNWGGLLATSVVIVLPALVLFVAFQQHFIDSLAGSVKG